MERGLSGLSGKRRIFQKVRENQPDPLNPRSIVNDQESYDHE